MNDDLDGDVDQARRQARAVERLRSRPGPQHCERCGRRAGGNRGSSGERVSSPLDR